jgi:tetratricopeptide (TPR) repeat protein
MRLGSLEEAKLALRSYLESVGIPNVDAQIISNRNDYQNMDFGDSVTQAKSRLLESEETLALVLQVIATGIELYGHEDQNGPLAAFLSDLSIALLESDDEAVSEKESVKIYRLRGTAYSLLAIHSEEPKDRSQYHQESLQYLQKAITLDNTDWKSFYELGLQQAIMRDTHAAIVSCCKSIELNPQFSSSWHLLALLYSCKRSDSLSKALQTVEAGLKVSYYSKYLVDHTSSQGIPAFSWTENSTEHSASELFENAESYMSLRMSHITLVEASQGAEAAMKLYEELFVLYNQLTQQLGLTAQQQIVKDLEVSGPPDDTILPSDSASRKSSISAIRRASISSLTSSISRRRSSSVDEKRSPVPPTLVARKAESDTDEMSEDTEASSRRRKHHGRRRNSLRRKSSAATTEEMRKKSLQLVDLGMAKRIGTAAANPSQRNILNQGMYSENTCLYCFDSFLLYSREY